MNQTPRDLGYRLPAEWESHSTTWLAWPHNPATWPGKLEEALKEYGEFARLVAQFEALDVLAGGEGVLRSAESWLGSLSNVTFHDIPTDDAWIRDYGPMFVGSSGHSLAVVDWGYNAWGGKYPPYSQDAVAAQRITKKLHVRRFAPEMVLEGGSIEGNGSRSVLVTRTCLLNPNRNPRLSRAKIESLLADHLGVESIIWLDGQIVGDDTDGHIDQLARFVDQDTVVVATESDPSDANYQSLSVLRAQLEKATLTDGRRPNVVPLPMPEPVLNQGVRLPASYANFYLVNSAVIVPQFDVPTDDRACRVLQELFPHRDVIGMPCRHLVLGLGAFHCLTQHQPDVVC